MRFSDIKIGHIYNVIFDPVKDCEFDGKHLSLVLKKNNDKSTFIVMPFTSASNGTGVNKVHVGQISTLPTSLKGNSTFAVFNQIRTVNANRFIALKEGGAVIECPVEKELFDKLLILGIREVIFSLPQDDKISVLKSAYEAERVTKAKDLAYTILGLQKSATELQADISRIKLEIKNILQDIPYSLEQKYIDDGIQNILDDSMKV